MSKPKEKLNETALNELMVVIRRNSEESACIKNFECLLREIDDYQYVNCVVSSMFNFLTETFELFGAVDRVPQKRFKAKMVSVDFIEPMRFFSGVKRMANETMKVRAAIERAERVYTDITVDTERNIVGVEIPEAERLINKFVYGIDIRDSRHRMKEYVDWVNIVKDFIEPEDELKEKSENLKELARKEMLLWNYIPAVIKAIIQTKRRSLDMDTNSKRFGK